ncbi:MAG TPA: aminotransferase class V-fold PLP-dependent enzyme, partial [Thermoleophilaceae bacterium]|nr:aminotransferase class V-fold PLP-dependent enzyme [Thermoleophilaceae bacterium]
MRPDELRAEFPVLERVEYLNAGTDGPMPARAERAAAERLRRELQEGRSGRRHRESLGALRERVRSHLADLLGCRAGEVALTHSTTDGINTILSALELGQGDEVLTSDEEHPGLLAPLAAAERRSGVTVRVVPFEALADAVGPETRLVACSQVSWVTGRVADTDALATTGAPVLLDGAQGLGAVPTKVGELGCDFYAAAGQKWLCGPDGTGCLYVRDERIRGLPAPWPGYESLSAPGRAAELPLHPDARRLDRGAGSGPLAAWWLTSIELLSGTGWKQVHARAVALAERLAGRL